MESIFSAGRRNVARLPARNFRCAAQACARTYCVRVLTDVVRPLGALTVVVQLLKTAISAIAATIGIRMVRIMFLFGSSTDSQSGADVSVSARQKSVTMRIAPRVRGD